MPNLVDATAIYVGTTAAQAVYQGDVLIWPQGKPLIPSGLVFQFVGVPPGPQGMVGWFRITGTALRDCEIMFDGRNYMSGGSYGPIVEDTLGTFAWSVFTDGGYVSGAGTKSAISVPIKAGDTGAQVVTKIMGVFDGESSDEFVPVTLRVAQPPAVFWSRVVPQAIRGTTPTSDGTVFRIGVLSSGQPMRMTQSGHWETLAAWIPDVTALHGYWKLDATQAAQTP